MQFERSQPLNGETAGPQIRLSVCRARSLSRSESEYLAVGITMMQHHLSRKAAFEMLRQGARCQQRKLAEVAQSIIHAAETLVL